MHKVYLSYNNIVSNLGFDSATVYQNLKNGNSGISKIEDAQFKKPLFGALIDTTRLDSEFDGLNPKDEHTRLEKMLILSLSNTIAKSGITLNDRVGLIVSTTKGNIDLLGNPNPFKENRAYLSELGKEIANYFDFKNEPIVLSNACITGLLAISIAKRYIEADVYDHVFIVAGDIISEFVVSGFQSFQALSDSVCAPYDIRRNGINLGEAGCSALVTKNKEFLSDEAVGILGEASCNDANHISGPSRTGEGLYRSVKNAMEETKIGVKDLDYISAHGTATLFNDEMEAIALDRLGLNKVPMNSLKGYFGHTLGASGLLETIIGMHTLHHNILLKSQGFETLGVSKFINVIKENSTKELSVFLKTASGFGGCNAAMIFQKVN